MEKVVISDLNGRHLIQQAIDPNQTKFSFDISGLPAGVYLLADMANGFVPLRFVVAN